MMYLIYLLRDMLTWSNLKISYIRKTWKSLILFITEIYELKNIILIFGSLRNCNQKIYS